MTKGFKVYVSQRGLLHIILQYYYTMITKKNVGSVHTWILDNRYKSVKVNLLPNKSQSQLSKYCLLFIYNLCIYLFIYTVVGNDMFIKTFSRVV